MNRLLIIYGFALLASPAIAETQQEGFIIPAVQVVLSDNNEFDPCGKKQCDTIKDYTLNLDEIEYIDEEEIELGFDTSAYLPEGFDPQVAYFDLNSVEYVEYDEDYSLGFDTTAFLPQDFDPYSANVGLNAINFIEDEEVELGFDTAVYLPEGFSPFESYFDINSIIYIDIKELESEFIIYPIIQNTASTEAKLYK